MIDKSKMIDDRGIPYTQSLFLECVYDEDVALYTFKEQDHEFKGRTFLSIKRLYLEMEDVTEYEFASTYFLNWNHWLRICENKRIRKEIDEWRSELELKLRSRAVKSMIKSANSGNYQASKWLADREWKQRGAGRPSKAEIDREKKIQSAINDEYTADVVRLFKD